MTVLQLWCPVDMTNKVEAWGDHVFALLDSAWGIMKKAEQELYFDMGDRRVLWAQVRTLVDDLEPGLADQVLESHRCKGLSLFGLAHTDRRHPQIRLH